VLVTLWPLRALAGRVFVRFRPGDRRLLVELRQAEGASPVLEALERSGGRVESLELEDTDGRRRLSLRVQFAREEGPAQALAELSRLDQVTAVQWST
jgi:hypothetical protein